MKAGVVANVAMGPGREFDLIRSLVEHAGALPPGVVVGPGDDATVLEGGLVLTCDMAVEDVHFRRDWLSVREIGFRAAAAALSDLAAMASRPLAALVAYALPPDRGHEMGRELHRGVEEACRLVGAGVVGGDVTASPGPLVVDVFGVGRAETPVLRGGARPGDELWVTGRLGAAAAAVALLLDGGEPPASLRRPYARPHPRTAEALWLAERTGIAALIDLSDGLAGDAGHVAAASGVTLVLDADRVPVAPGVADALGGADAALDAALSGGEDYELLLAVRPGALDTIGDPFRETFGLSLSRVGEVVEAGEEGVLLRRTDGPPSPPARRGFDHFRRDPA